MLRICDTHGNAAFLDASRSGNLSMLRNSAGTTSSASSASMPVSMRSF